MSDNEVVVVDNFIRNRDYYLTLEHRSDLAVKLLQNLSDVMYGCDDSHDLPTIDAAITLINSCGDLKKKDPTNE